MIDFKRVAEACTSYYENTDCIHTPEGVAEFNIGLGKAAVAALMLPLMDGEYCNPLCPWIRGDTIGCLCKLKMGEPDTVNSPEVALKPGPFCPASAQP